MEPDGQFDYRPFSTIARPLCTRKSSNLQPYDPKSHNAAGELCRLSKECIELALVQGDPTIIGKFVRPVDLSGTFSTSLHCCNEALRQRANNDRKAAIEDRYSPFPNCGKAIVTQKLTLHWDVIGALWW